MIFVGAAITVLGTINAVISLRNAKAKGFNLTRLKFVVYTWGLLVLGLVLLVRALLHY